MTEADKHLLTFLLMYISGEEQDIHHSEIDWKRLMKLSSSQAVTTLIIDCMQKHFVIRPDNKFFANEEDWMKFMKWIGKMIVVERNYANHKKAISDLARLYSSNGIRMMVLKGYGLSLDWPVPNHRPTGDLDIYNFGKWQDSDTVVAEQYGIKVDDRHEHHTVFRFDEVTVENHYDFINTKAHRDAERIETRLKQLAEKDYNEIEVNGARVYLPSANFNAIFLMRHMAQHFAGDHLLLRQVLDWGFFVRAHSHEVDWTSTIEFLKEIGLYDFFNVVNAICVSNIGFSENVFPPIERQKQMEERILNDIFRPESDEKKPHVGLFAVLSFKTRRWWRNRWKHQLVYNDNLIMTFMTLAWSHLMRFETIKD